MLAGILSPFEASVERYVFDGASDESTFSVVLVTNRKHHAVIRKQAKGIKERAHRTVRREKPGTAQRTALHREEATQLPEEVTQLPEEVSTSERQMIVMKSRSRRRIKLKAQVIIIVVILM